jgi:hypothetical protein
MLGLLSRASQRRSAFSKLANSPKSVQVQSSSTVRVSSQTGSKITSSTTKWRRQYCTESFFKINSARSTQNGPRIHPPRHGRSTVIPHSEDNTAMYSDEKVHIVPEKPTLWSSGAVPREHFLTFLNDLLSAQNWSGASRLYAQLVYQTHHTDHVVNADSVKEILKDQLPALPLPALSEFELFAIFFALHRNGLNQHAMALWNYFETESHHGKPILKPHVHYYSQAFEGGAYTKHSDVRNVQLLVSVLEVANTLKDSATVAKVFERLTGGLVSNLKSENASKKKIPVTPLWHVSYHRQLRVFEIALSHLDARTQATLIVTYINTYRLKFATCWTPKSVVKMHALLSSCISHNDEIKPSAELLNEIIQQFAAKISDHATLRTIRTEPSLHRVQRSMPYININSCEANMVKFESDEFKDPETPTTHPGLVNLIARAIELSAPENGDKNYQIVKQIYLECFEAPYYFQELTSIAEPSLKFFCLHNDGDMVAWMYQRMIEQDIGMSVNLRNILMHWSLRVKNDPSQCIEFFNDMLVSLGPQSANAATIILLLEAVEMNRDLDAAMNVVQYVREHIKSWTIYKQALETSFVLALEKRQDDILLSLIDEMCAQVPQTFNERWRPQIVDYMKKNSLDWRITKASTLGKGTFL